VALNALLPYMATILDELAIPGGGAPLRAFVTPPTQVPLTNPVCYILPSTMHGRRRTAPRPVANMELEWWVDLLLTFETKANMPTIDQQFALIVDAILYACWGTVMPIQITDAVTARTTSIAAIGEEVELESNPVETPASYRMLLYKSLLRIQVKEWVQA
jgi:hypothetical protein